MAEVWVLLQPLAEPVQVLGSRSPGRPRGALRSQRRLGAVRDFRALQRPVDERLPRQADAARRALREDEVEAEGEAPAVQQQAVPHVRLQQRSPASAHVSVRAAATSGRLPVGLAAEWGGHLLSGLLLPQQPAAMAAVAPGGLQPPTASRLPWAPEALLCRWQLRRQREAAGPVQPQAPRVLPGAQEAMEPALVVHEDPLRRVQRGPVRSGEAE
mmetsp:Transcript_64281/g.188069  ORF Transcript_64281/g.188069 Transcript_64281/m.188069 type:complete len:214 (+) Transcript_64281:409-1050(+)